MQRHQVVLDTNVLVSALRSKRGASFRLLSLLGSEKFQIVVTVPLVLEYEANLLPLVGQFQWTEEDINALLDVICALAQRQQVFYLWRPFLKDPKDDMVLEAAVAADCNYIVTYNKDDFRGAEQFGLHVVTAKEFLEAIGELK